MSKAELDFAQCVQTFPTDASDCSDREASLAEVKRIRRCLRGFVKEEKRRELANEARDAELAARRTSGKVRLIYSIYDRLFDIVDGAISVEEVDEEYCLSHVMRGCSLELIGMTPQARLDLEVAGVPTPFIEKTVRWNFDVGEWRCLYTYDSVDREPKKYWIVVFQDPKQREADLAKTRHRTMAKKRVAKVVVPDGIVKSGQIRGSSSGGGGGGGTGEEAYYYGNNVGYVEGCSCLEGNPCTEFNKYNCKDWDNRIAVALANS